MAGEMIKVPATDRIRLCCYLSIDGEQMAGKIILITSVGDDDPRFSGLFEVALYEVRNGTYGDGDPLTESESFTTYDEAEGRAKTLATEQSCEWKNAWE